MPTNWSAWRTKMISKRIPWVLAFQVRSLKSSKTVEIQLRFMKSMAIQVNTAKTVFKLESSISGLSHFPVFHYPTGHSGHFSSYANCSLDTGSHPSRVSHRSCGLYRTISRLIFSIILSNVTRNTTCRIPHSRSFSAVVRLVTRLCFSARVRSLFRW